MKEIIVSEVGVNTILDGRAFAGYCPYENTREWASKVCGDVPYNVWYTERNGDCISLVVPDGTRPEELPSFCMGYIIFRWIQPEDDFGGDTEVVPVRFRR